MTQGGREGGEAMTPAELREKVACAIPLPLLAAKDAERAADAAIRIIAEACAEAVIVDSRDLVDPWSIAHLAKHWAKRIRDLIPKEPNNV